MAAHPASIVSTISPAEMQILVSRSGLALNPGQMADLVLAWRQVAGLIAAIPQGRKLADDMALTFRLPSPAPAGAAARAAANSGAKSAGKAPAKPATKRASAAKPASPAKSRPKRKAQARRPASRAR